MDVCTVKTDAFTIPSSKLEVAGELLNWEAGIGSWRFSRSDDIKLLHPLVLQADRLQDHLRCHRSQSP